MRSKVTIKTSVCWAATFSVEGIYILKMEFIISYKVVLNIINGNFGLVKSGQKSPKAIGAGVLFAPF